MAWFSVCGVEERTLVQRSHARRSLNVRWTVDGSAESKRSGGLGREVALSLASMAVCVGVLLLLWELVALAGVFPSIVLATPAQVWASFGTELQSGNLLFNTAVTLREAFLGFLVGAAVAGPIGYLIVQVRLLEFLITPFVAAVQGVPAVAIAPIILLLFSGNLLPKVIICAIVVIFPLLITTITALKGVGREYLDVARVFGASRVQTLVAVQLPLAAPVLLAGLKLGITLSITGAVVAEFVASDAGLGFMVNTAVNSFEVSTRYVAVLTLATLSAVLFGSFTLIERIVEQWVDL
jgi:NitT/TauT family transport system permease protein